MTEAQTILWQRLDTSGHESARVLFLAALGDLISTVASARWSPHVISSPVVSTAITYLAHEVSTTCDSGWVLLTLITSLRPITHPLSQVVLTS